MKGKETIDRLRKRGFVWDGCECWLGARTVMAHLRRGRGRVRVVIAVDGRFANRRLVEYIEAHFEEVV